MPIKAVRVCAVSELRDGGVKVFTVGGREGLVIRAGEEIFACDRYCTHERFPLDFGRLEEGAKLCCTYHGAKFDLKTGAATLPAKAPLRTYKVQIDGDDVVVELPS